MKKRRILFIIVIAALLIGRGVFLAKKPMPISSVANFREPLDIKSIEICGSNEEGKFGRLYYTEDFAIIQEIYKTTILQDLEPVLLDTDFDWASKESLRVILEVSGRDSPISFDLDGEKICIQAYSKKSDAEADFFKICRDYYDYIASYTKSER